MTDFLGHQGASMGRLYTKHLPIRVMTKSPLKNKIK